MSVVPNNPEPEESRRKSKSSHTFFLHISKEIQDDHFEHLMLQKGNHLPHKIKEQKTTYHINSKIKMRNDLLHIMPHMYYASPTPRSRNVFNLSPSDILRHRYEQELAEQQAYEEEMAEQRYQQRLYNELMRRRQAEQQYAIEQERERRRLVAEREQQRRQRAAREQALRVLLNEEKEREEARLRRTRAINTMSQPRMRSQFVDSTPRVFQGPDGRLYREVFPNNDMREEMEVESDDEEYDVPLPHVSQTQFKPSIRFGKPIRHEERKRSQASKPPVMLHVVDANPPKVTIAPKAIPKKPTVMVEDASDSECEDEFKSYIRNRRPRDGEWIEPVEAFKL